MRGLTIALTSTATALMLASCSSSGSSTPSPGPASAPAGSSSRTAPSTSALTQSPVAPESNPAGDIPDNLAFVPYTNAAGHYSFSYPEGWATRENGTKVVISDKLNSITADIKASDAAPTEASARSQRVPELSATVPAFELVGISATTIPAGPAIRITYRANSEPDPVTGRQHREEVQELLVWSKHRLLTIDLAAIVGADNVDAYKTIVDSIRIQ